MTNRWRWRSMRQQIREATPNTLLRFTITPPEDADKARRALWREFAKLKERNITLETSIGKARGDAILYVYLRPSPQPQLCPHCGQAI